MENNVIYKGFITFLYSILIITLGWAAVNINQANIELAKLQTELKRIDITLVTIQNSMSRNFYTKTEAELEFRSLEKRVDKLESR